MSPQDHILKDIAKGGGLAFPVRVASDVLGFVNTLLLTNVLGAHLFGIYALGRSIFRISAKAALLGMNSGILRYFSVYRDRGAELRGLVKSSLITVGLCSCLVMLVYLVLARVLAVEVFRKWELESVARIFALAIPIASFVTLIGAMFQSEKRILLFLTVGDLDQKLFNLALLVLFLGVGLGLKGAAIAFLLSTAGVLVLAVVLFKRHIAPLLRADHEATHLKELLSFCMPSFLTGFSYIVLTQIDRIMIGLFMESSAVGIYATASNIANLMNVVMASFNTMFVPYISELFFSGKTGELSGVYKVVTRWVLAVSAPLFGIFVFFSEIVLTAFGKEFSSGAGILIVLASWLLVHSSTGSNGFLLQMAGRPYLELTNCIVLALANVGLNILLIPRFGGEGAALATGMSMAAINLLRLVEIRGLMGLHPFSKGYWRIVGVLLLSLGAAAVPYHLLDGVWLRSVMGLVVFLVCYAGGFRALCLGEDDAWIVDSLRRRLKALLGR